MNMKHGLFLVLSLTAVAAWAEDAAPAQSAEPAAPAEQPYQGEPVTVTEQRSPLENAFREVQIGLDRTRSSRLEDAEKIVCLKQKPTGSNISVINCATNRFWEQIRENSLGGIGGFTGAAGASGANTKKGDRVFTMSLAQYRALEKQFGPLPKEMLGQR